MGKESKQLNNSLLLFELFFLKLLGYRQFILSAGRQVWNVDEIKVVLLEKEKAQRQKGVKDSVSSKADISPQPYYRARNHLGKRQQKAVISLSIISIIILITLFIEKEENTPSLNVQITYIT